MSYRCTCSVEEDKPAFHPSFKPIKQLSAS